MTAPKSTAAATRLLERYAELDGKLAVIEERRSAEIGRANSSADAEASPLRSELEAIAGKLEPWWDGAAATIAGGKKSVELGGCMIGTRMSRPKLAHGFESDDKATEALRQTRWSKQTTRVRYSLDRTATAKLLTLRGKAAADLAALGFAIEQADSFYVERVKQAATIGS